MVSDYSGMEWVHPLFSRHFQLDEVNIARDHPSIKQSLIEHQQQYITTTNNNNDHDNKANK